VRRYIVSKELDITFPVGHSMNSEQRAAWERFLANEDTPLALPEQKPENPQIEASAHMSMSKFSLSFSGKIDVNMITSPHCSTFLAVMRLVTLKSSVTLRSPTHCGNMSPKE